MEQPPPAMVDEVIPLLETVVANAAAPEHALADLHRAWWQSIYPGVPNFDGPWQLLSDLKDAIELCEPNPAWRAGSSALFGPDEAVARVRAALASLGRNAAP